MLLPQLLLLMGHIMHHSHPKISSSCQTNITKLKEDLKLFHEKNHEWQELLGGLSDRKEKLLLEWSKEGDVEMVKKLLAFHPNISAQDYHLRTPLYLAAYYGYEEVAKVLLDAGADTEIYNEHNNTPIIMAAHNGHIEVLQLLLDKGAKVNVADIHNNTALHYAALYGYLPIVKLLVEHGADVNMTNNVGKTPEMLAHSKHNHDVVHWLHKESIKV